MYVKLPAIKDAASFNSLTPILSEPVAFVRSIFRRYFSIFSQDISGIEKICPWHFFRYKAVAVYLS